MRMRMVELFSGIGATRAAMVELGIEHDAICCEIDPQAYRAYCAIHGDTPNLGDITKVEHLPDCDLVTWSYPCTSCSIAGKQEGMVEGSGTASSLCWEVIRLVRDAVARGVPPRALVMENVPAILSPKNEPEFRRMTDALAQLGYKSRYAILNAKDYGVPQSRKRCFMVSSLDGVFEFPEPCPDGRVLEDVLEDVEDVPEKYYLSESRLEGLMRSTGKQMDKGNGFRFKPKGTEDTAFTVTTQAGSRKTDNFVCVQTATLAGKGHDCIKRIYSISGMSPTVTTACGGGHIPKIELDGMRFRKLSPLECWRLQGFSDEAYEKVKALGYSDTVLYRLAGNSIAVPCLTAIFRKMYRPEKKSQTTLDGF
jgi:DNA (cytosine-5)-methyltransferase 1